MCFVSCRINRLLISGSYLQASVTESARSGFLFSLKHEAPLDNVKPNYFVDKGKQLR